MDSCVKVEEYRCRCTLVVYDSSSDSEESIVNLSDLMVDLLNMELFQS